MGRIFRRDAILKIIRNRSSSSVSEILAEIDGNVSKPTLNRDLAELVRSGQLIRTGKGRSIRYQLSPAHKLFLPSPSQAYFEREPDSRSLNNAFDYELLRTLRQTPLFTTNEIEHLESLQTEFQRNIFDIPGSIYQKEMERLTIDLSWKSSQIEGNTYSLLETEQLFVQKQLAPGKTKEEAAMLLNHKTCLEFIVQNKQECCVLDLRLLEQIHSLIAKDLGIDVNLRTRPVGITGSGYKPLDNQFQIREAVDYACQIINEKASAFEKALLAVLLVSYIQPFADGNKRTARMASNAVLLASDACPISYRSVDSIEYKKAMLLFYEQHNITAFKEMFIEQVEFAVKNYFR